MGKKNHKLEPAPIIRFEDVMTMDNILKSYKHVRRGKKMRTKTIFYHMNHMTHLKNLYKSIEDKTYKIGELSRFTVFEPKQREVIANRFEDKIVQDVISKHVLKPLLSPKLIYDNYASQPKKGTHKALHRLERYTMIYAKSVDWDNRGWVLIGDIKKFFYMIDHGICKDLVKGLPIDEPLAKLLRDQIDTCTPDINPYTDEAGKGLCIGFQTSQWLAVYYLNKLDHLIKEKLHIKCYGRYMDDFYLIHENREYLEYCYRVISDFIKNVMHMEMNKKSHIHPFSQGICFLGYHVTYNPGTHQVETVIRRKSINKMLKRTKKQVNLVHQGKITSDQADASLQSWNAYACHGDCEKAKNAYAKAKEMVHDRDGIVDEYRRYFNDWTNVDSKGFFRLKVRDDVILRDIDGFAILKHKKKSKREKWAEARREEVLDNPEKYAQANLMTLLDPDLYIHKARKKKTRERIASKRTIRCAMLMDVEPP